MLLADTHLHSTVSFDGKNNRYEMAAAAFAQGYGTVCFTDHYDVINQEDRLIPVYDWEPARAEHREAIERLAGKGEVLYGVELGNAPSRFPSAELALTEPGLDFVLGSIHNGSEALKNHDVYYVDYNTPEICYTYLDDYFDSMDRLLDWGDFDSLAHIPYPLRYMVERDHQPVALTDYADHVRQILRRLVETGKAMEINSTRSLPIRPEYGWLLDQYRELGGELITIGSDAHRVPDLGRGIPEAYELARAKGFRYVTIYRGRKPYPEKI